MIDKELIKKRIDELENAKEALKREFIGIDGIIDSIIDNITNWYVFPEAVSKPIVINLWGQTGSGKTALVDMLCNILNVENRTIYYNMSKMDDDNSDTMESMISRTIASKTKNPVFVFDEFQHAASIDKEGMEISKKTSIKTIWDMIDSGKMKIFFETYDKDSVFRINLILKSLNAAGVKINNKKIEGIEKAFEIEGITESLIHSYINYDGKKFTEEDDESEWCQSERRSLYNNKNFWLTAKCAVDLFDVYSKTMTNKESLESFYERISSMDLKDITNFTNDIDKLAQNGYIADYSGAIVFVIGNIDEAYETSYSMDPDMDPDSFNEITSKLTSADIKEALKKRFRNEQISRLGNIILTYPSFTSESFRKIIDLNLNRYSKTVMNLYGISLSYDSTIKDAIYNEGVFPSQGVRPILSTIHEIVMTKLPTVLLKGSENGNPESIKMSYQDGYVVSDVITDLGENITVKVKQPLRIDDNRKPEDSEMQAIAAVHESAHFVMYTKMYGKLPEKLVSNAVSSEANGFMLRSDNNVKYKSATDYIKDICVYIAGYVAEKTVFGEQMLTSGASSDIEKATSEAMAMLSHFGMSFRTNGSIPVRFTYLTTDFGTNDGLLINSEDDNKNIANEAIFLIGKCVSDVYDTLKDPDWGKMFAKSCKYMFSNTSMPKSVMEDIYMEVPEKKRKEFPQPQYYYRDTMNEFVSKLL